jgi:hypothetical protein
MTGAHALGCSGGGRPGDVGVCSFEQMNQAIIAYHVPANGTITLNEELDDFHRMPLHECSKLTTFGACPIRNPKGACLIVAVRAAQSGRSSPSAWKPRCRLP